ncbi:MAG: phage/plasmid primase, P4 family [Acidobacteriaceae bacterium]
MREPRLRFENPAKHFRDSVEHALLFMFGTGANGKSVFVSTLLGILGGYAVVAPMTTFTETHNAAHPTDLAMLRGARLVAATETVAGSRWAEAKIKAITGGEPITARFMRQDFFTYVPQFKLFVSGNHKPRLRSVDEAVRRRLNLIPFVVTFDKTKRDCKLTEKLRAEWGGILQWAIDGCLACQREGLNPPQIVTAATDEYLAEQDVLGQWLEESVVPDKNARTQPSEIYQHFRRWAEAHGEYVFGQREFALRLTEHGYASKKGHGGARTLALRFVSAVGENRRFAGKVVRIGR